MSAGISRFVLHIDELVGPYEMIESVPPVVGSCSRGLFRLIYPQVQPLLLLVLITTCLLYVWVFTLTVFEGVWVFTLTVFEGVWGSSL